MMRVILHGALAKAVGRARWRLSVSSASEALRLIEANTGKLYRYLYNEGAEVPFRILVNGKDLHQEAELSMPFLSTGSIHFVPVIGGAAGSSGGILLAIGAVLLIVAAVAFLQPEFAAEGSLGLSAAVGGSTVPLYAGLAFSLGLSFTLSGISQLITGTPQTAQNDASYILNGPVNTVNQGNPVPIAYGLVICGSQTISAGVRSTEIPLTN